MPDTDEYTVIVLASREQIICDGAYDDWHEAWVAAMSPYSLMQVTPAWDIGQVTVNPIQITTIRPCSTAHAENYRIIGGYLLHG